MKRHRSKPSPENPRSARPAGSSPAVPGPVRGPIFLSALFGLFFGLCLLKFGNPPIMEKFVDPPKSAFDALVITPWPIHCAYWLLGSLTLLSFCSSRFRASLFEFFSSLVIRLPRRSPTEAGHSSLPSARRSPL